MLSSSLPLGQGAEVLPQQAAGQEEHDKIFLLVLELTNPDQVRSDVWQHLCSGRPTPA